MGVSDFSTNPHFAVAFDLDGVLVDAEVHWRALGPEFLATIVPGWSVADQRSIHGMSIEHVFEHLRGIYKLELSRDELLRRYEDLARDIYGVRCALLPDAHELLRSLRTLGAELAIVSSAPNGWIEIVLSRFDLGEMFAVVIGAEDVAREVKPSPAPYRKALERLSMSPKNVVAIEDSAKGIQSAKSAGLRCVAVKGPFRTEQDLSEADELVESVSALDPLRIARYAGVLPHSAILV